MRPEDAILALYNHSKAHPLYAETLLRKEQIVIYRGNLHEPNYLLIGEAPGNEEANKGEPFVGPAGKHLNEWLEDTEITNYCIINAMTIKPTKPNGHIRKPTTTEIHYFRPYILALIISIKAQRIILLGKTATEAMGLAWKPFTWYDAEISKVGIMYHPAYYLHSHTNGVRDFRHLLRLAEEPTTKQPKDLNSKAP